MYSQKKEIPSKLCIFNLDPQVGNVDILSICRKHGKIISFFRTLDKKTAFLKYKTENEAQNAIPVLTSAGFYVNIAFERSDREHQVPFDRICGKVINPKKIFLFNLDIELSGSEIHSACSRYGKIDYFHRSQCKTKVYCAYGTEIEAKNALTKLRGDGIDVTFAWEKSNLIQQKESNHNNSTESKFDACSFCGNEAILKCSVCADAYCSKKCQDDDWPLHKKKCSPIPVLEPIPATIGSKRRLNFDVGQEVVESSKYHIPKIRITSVCGAWKTGNVTNKASQKNSKTVAHYPKLKLKGGICHVCNELTKEHCQLCELPLCIRATTNCFYTFHVKIAVDENQHFLYKNETTTLCRCKNCNERKARFHCTKCSNETSGKKAFFCFTNNKNCFEQFHSRI